MQADPESLADEDPTCLYLRCASSIERFCLRQLNGRPAVAEELMQETFYRLVRDYDLLRARGAWRPVNWLFTTAANLCTDWLRHEQVHYQAMAHLLVPLLRNPLRLQFTDALPPTIRVETAEVVVEEDGTSFEIALSAEPALERQVFGDELQQRTRDAAALLLSKVQNRGSSVAMGLHLLLHIANRDRRIALPELAAEHGLTLAQAKTRLYKARLLARRQVHLLPPELLAVAVDHRVGRSAELTRRMIDGQSAKLAA